MPPGLFFAPKWSYAVFTDHWQISIQNPLENPSREHYLRVMNAEKFPSGEWTGFYVYSRIPNRFLMDLQLTFSAGRISGSGWDDIGSFTIVGTYCDQSMECVWEKHYHGRHSVNYRGFREGKGIWGTWTVEDSTGGFHIWPLGAGEEIPAHWEEFEEVLPAEAIRR